MGLVDAIGSFIIGTGKVAGGALLQTGKMGIGLAGAIGKGTMATGSAIGKGVIGMSEKVGKVVTEPFTTANIGRTGRNWGGMLGDIGKTFVYKNDKGHLRLTKRGLLTVGGLMTYSKLSGRYFDEKSENLGTVDQRPTTLTPNFNPVQYVAHPPNRITADSGGATGDLVFALHRMR